MKAKIEFNFNFGPDDDKKYRFKSIESEIDISGQAFDLMDHIMKIPEYKLYINLFNEVKLLGVGIKCVPNSPDLNENVNPIRFAINYKEDGVAIAPNYIYPTNSGNTYKFFKNFSRRWVPANQTASVMSQGRDLTFNIGTSSVGTGNVARMPRWNVIFTAYVVFRKNLTL